MPLVSAAFNLLSIAAAYGVVVLVFQQGVGSSLLGVDGEVPIVSFVPLMMFAILFGLSMDYNVFLQSRIREEYMRGVGPQESVVRAMSRVGKIILAAGVIMTSVFLGFVSDPDVVVKTIGLGLAAAILIDVLVVRMVVAPAVMTLLGDRAWTLPAWLDRVLPRISLEGDLQEGEAPPEPASRERKRRARAARRGRRISVITRTRKRRAAAAAERRVPPYSFSLIPIGGAGEILSPSAGESGFQRGGVVICLRISPSEATTVDAGGRELRVSSPDRVIFPATERTPAVTKLDVVGVLPRRRGRHHARAAGGRPTTLERWPKGVHPGIVLSTREKGGGDAFFQKRVPRAPRTTWRRRGSSSRPGRHADEICPTEIAVVGWAAQMGTITFHPWPVRRDDVDHPDELRLDLDPQPGTDFDDAVRVAAEARVLLDELGYIGFPKTSGGRGVHIYVRIEPRWTFTDVRHAAIAFGRELERRLPDQVTTKWWKEERGEQIFVDYNQNARDRTIASAYSVRPKPGAPVSAPLTWDELAARRARGLHRRNDARPLCRAGRSPRRDRRRRPFAAAAVGHVRARRGGGRGRHALPARLPEDARRAQSACSRRATATAGPDDQALRRLRQLGALPRRPL